MLEIVSLETIAILILQVNIQERGDNTFLARPSPSTIPRLNHSRIKDQRESSQPNLEYLAAVNIEGRKRSEGIQENEERVLSLT
jgi:hypothetical protein